MDILLLILFVAMQVCDWITTTLILRDGGREVNPIMAKLFSALGMHPALALTKAVAIVLALYLTVTGAWWMVGLIDVIYLAVVVHNLRQMTKGDGHA